MVGLTGTHYIYWPAWCCCLGPQPDYARSITCQHRHDGYSNIPGLFARPIRKDKSCKRKLAYQHRAPNQQQYHLLYKRFETQQITLHRLASSLNHPINQSIFQRLCCAHEVVTVHILEQLLILLSCHSRILVCKIFSNSQDLLRFHLDI